MTDVAEIIVDMKKLKRLSDVLKPEQLENLRKYLVARDEIMNRAIFELRDKAFISTFYIQDGQVINAINRALSLSGQLWPPRFK